MEDNKIIQRIEDLKPTTESHISGIQKGLVPSFVDLRPTLPGISTTNPYGNKAQYNIGEEICFAGDGAYFVIKVQNLPYNEAKINERSDRYFISRLTDLMNKQEIRPVLFFYDNHFIPWSKIRVVHNKDSSFILIDDLTDDSKTLSCITFPFNISYNETGLFKNYPETILLFNENGELDPDGKYVVQTTNARVMHRSHTATQGFLHHEVDAPEEYTYNSFNCIIFKNGLLYPEAKIEFEGYNLLTIDDGAIEANSTLTYQFFYNTYTSINEGNPNIIPNTEVIKTSIKNDSITLKPLTNDLDYSFDPNTDYANNVKTALNAVVKHNMALMEQIYKDNSRIIIETYTGSQFTRLVKKGKVTFSTKWKYATQNNCRHMPNSPITYDNYNLIEVRPMVFINGELLPTMGTMSIDDNKCSIVIDTESIKSSDTITVLFFKGINNEVIKYQTDVEEGNHIPYACSEDILNKIEKDNLMIYSPEAPSDAIMPITSVDENDRVQYSLPISIIENQDNGKIDITITDEYDYSGQRTLAFVAKNQFRHMGIIIYQEYQFNAMLSPEFNYCTNKDQYMVFINGRKIEQKHFKIISADPRYPFDDVSIYLFIEMEKGDRLDVFYLPFVCAEHTIKPSIPINGNIYLDKEAFDYSLSKHLYLFFINGKFIDPNRITDIDSSRVCINTPTETTKNLCILQHIPVNIILQELFKNTDIVSVWESVFGVIDQATLRSMLNINQNINLGDTENDKYEWQLTAKEVIFEIARDYWLSERIYQGDVFVYNYDNIELTKEDFINAEVAKIEDFDVKDPTGKTIANIQHGHVDFLRTKNGFPATQDDIKAYEESHPKK